jgi:hypothetical protein
MPCFPIPITDLQSQTLSYERNRRRTFVFAENGLRDPELATFAAACHTTQSSLQCREHVIDCERVLRQLSLNDWKPPPPSVLPVLCCLRPSSRDASIERNY